MLTLRTKDNDSVKFHNNELYIRPHDRERCLNGSSVIAGTNFCVVTNSVKFKKTLAGYSLQHWIDSLPVINDNQYVSIHQNLGSVCQEKKVLEDAADKSDDVHGHHIQILINSLTSQHIKVIKKFVEDLFDTHHTSPTSSVSSVSPEAFGLFCPEYFTLFSCISFFCSSGSYPYRP